ncbi:MAG TPA: TorF family putative porin [Xanthobacteraceae bacterium]
MATKAPPVAAAPPPSPWDVAITAALMTDYNFRGITQSAHNPSSQAGFELRYTQSPMWQYYAGISGESIDFPNNAAAEIDFYGGVRPTFDKLALDFGVWYYWYPGGDCYGVPGGGAGGCNGAAENGGIGVSNKNAQPFGGNVAKSNASFVEFYAKATYTINDQWATGVQYWYSPSVANTGATGNYVTGNLTYTAPSTWFQYGLGMYVSGDVGYWDLGTSDVFYGTGVGTPFANGVPYKSYTNWDAGIGFTYKAFTLDLRYYDTDLSKGNCNAFTSASNSSFSPGNVTNINPNGLGSNWCSAAYIAKLSFATNLSGIK